jgi:hypothetical protein
MRYLTKKEAAALFKCHEATLMRWVDEGIVSAPFRFAPNGPVLFDEADVAADIQRRKAAAKVRQAARYGGERERPVPRIRLKDHPEIA